MKTLSYPEYGRLQIAEQETPRIAPDEVLLQGRGLRRMRQRIGEFQKPQPAPPAAARHGP
jgi:hypothetical protein